MMRLESICPKALWMLMMAGCVLTVGVMVGLALGPDRVAVELPPAPASDGAEAQVPGSQRLPSLRPRSPHGGPEVLVSPSRIDLGTLRLGEVVHASVAIENTGTHSVPFGVLARCGCIRTEISPDVDVLAKNVRVELLIRFVLNDRVGRFREVVEVLLDDGRGTRKRVTLEGVVVGGVAVRRVSPPFEPVLPGAKCSVVLGLRGASDLPPWKPARVRVWPDDRADQASPCDAQVTEIEPHEDGGLRFEVAFDLPPSESVGRKRIWASVETTLGTDLSPRHLCSYDVHRAVRPAVKRMHLGVVGEPTSRPGKVRFLAANSRTHFALRAARVRDFDGLRDHPDFTARCEEDERGWHAIVTFHGARHPPRRVRGVLVVETDRGDVPYLEVEVSAVVPLREGDRDR